MRQAGFEPTTFGSVFLWSDHRPPASSAPLKAQSARGRTASWGRAAGPVIRKGVGLLLPLTPDSMANDLQPPLRASTGCRFRVCTASTNSHLSHALPAGPTDPCAVFPPELRVLGTSPAYAASS